MNRKHLIGIIISILVFVRFAIYLYFHTYEKVSFNEILFIRDLIWLDVWGLLFILFIITLFYLKIKNAVRFRILLFIFSIFGFISFQLILNGTVFGVNGYWGDQAFRITNVLKLMTSFPPTDFYYKDLPPFYPPMFFYFLAVLGKIFSLEAYETTKLGVSLLLLLCPFLLYKSWKPVIGFYRAIIVTISTFIVASVGYNYVIFNPYEFIGNSLFVPWWIYFIEMHNNKLQPVRYYLWGGITGVLLFSTYPFPFFIGGLFLSIKTVCLYFDYNKRKRNIIWKNWVLLFWTSILSAWYWLPTLLSIIKYGGKPSNQEWFHIGRTGLSFDFIQFNWLGVLLVISIMFAVYKYKRKINQHIVSFLVVTMLFYLLGLFLGAIDHPINILKAKTMITILCGTLLGLVMANILRVFATNKRNVSVVVFILIAFLYVNEFHILARNSQIKKAKTSKVQNWGISKELAKKITGKTFLTGVDKLSVFYPVYYFSSINQHYSHPASRYNSRYEFIKTLELVKDPFILNLAMRYNQFSPIDYVMPLIKNNKYYFPFNLSAYPNKSQSYKIEINHSIINNSDYFQKEKGTNIFSVLEPSKTLPQVKMWQDCYTFEDSAKKIFSTSFIYRNLTEDGQKVCDSYLDEKISSMNVVKNFSQSHLYAEKISLFSMAAIANNDSIYLFFGFRVNDYIYDNYKIFYHITLGKNKEFHNFDFAPPKSTSSLKPGKIFFASRIIPRLDDSLLFSVGFFKGDYRLGKAYNGKIQIK